MIRRSFFLWSPACSPQLTVKIRSSLPSRQLHIAPTGYRETHLLPLPSHSLLPLCPKFFSLIPFVSATARSIYPSIDLVSASLEGSAAPRCRWRRNGRRTFTWPSSPSRPSAMTVRNAMRIHFAVLFWYARRNLRHVSGFYLWFILHFSVLES